MTKIQEQEAIALLIAVRDGFDYDPGISDLDDEQPIHPCISLGAMRKIRGILRQLAPKAAQS